ncbi:hypothetical protein BC826DRAFT_266703 [Russula brevipes]|nr:hypothetical protein BC826DRAFT_266703 [Russula brevipes]
MPPGACLPEHGDRQSSEMQAEVEVRAQGAPVGSRAQRQLAVFLPKRLFFFGFQSAWQRPASTRRGPSQGKNPPSGKPRALYRRTDADEGKRSKSISGTGLRREEGGKRKSDSVSGFLRPRLQAQNKLKPLRNPVWTVREWCGTVDEQLAAF